MVPHTPPLTELARPRPLPAFRGGLVIFLGLKEWDYQAVQVYSRVLGRNDAFRTGLGCDLALVRIEIFCDQPTRSFCKASFLHTALLLAKRNFLLNF